jgi:hypothetical protein
LKEQNERERRELEEGRDVAFRAGKEGQLESVAFLME